MAIIMRHAAVIKIGVEQLLDLIYTMKYCPCVFKISRKELVEHGVPRGYELVMPCASSGHFWVKRIGWTVPDQFLATEKFL